MFKIVRFPSQLNNFFCSLKKKFHWDHYEYFRMLVLAIAFSWGRRNITSLYRFIDAKRHRSRFNNFLNKSRWEPEIVLQEKAYEFINQLVPDDSDNIYLIIDDSKKRKFGKYMDAISKMKDPISGAFMRGHQYVCAIIFFRGLIIPWGIRLYAKKEQCGALKIKFHKTTEMAAQLIREFVPPNGSKVKVLFDTYYLCQTVVNACRERGFHFVSTLKSNRNLFKNGRKLKAGKYGRNIYRNSEKQIMRIRKNGGYAVYHFVDAGWLTVGSLGKLHVIFSKKGNEKQKLGLVTDDPELSGKQIIQVYDKRWNIEVFFKDVKGLLGLGQYQNGSYQAAVIHLHLICFAYALLTHLKLNRKGEKGKSKKLSAHISTATLQNQLRHILWDDCVKYLKKFTRANSIVKELERLLIP